MKNQTINIGNNAFINSDKICVVISADAEKVRRMLKRKGIKSDSEKFWNTTGDSETRTMIVLENGTLVTSSVASVSIAKRINQSNKMEEDIDE